MANSICFEIMKQAQQVSSYVSERPMAAGNLSGIALLIPVAIPVAWILGFDFLYSLIWASAAIIFIRVIPSRPSLFEIAIFLLCAFLFMGLLAGFNISVSGESASTRILSAIYFIANIMASAYIFGLIFHSSTAVFERAFHSFLVGGAILFVMCVAFAVIVFLYALAAGKFYLEVPTVLGFVYSGNLPGIAERSQAAVLAAPDWGFGFPLPRPIIFAPWYTAGAMLALISGFLAMGLVASKHKGHIFEIAIDIITLIVVMLVLTRSLTALYVASFAISAFIFKDKRRLLMIYVAFLAAIPALVLGLIEFISEFRSYSTESRLTSYTLGLETALTLSPAFGIGYKPMVEFLSIPIGSHSSFISSLIRGGVLALGSFVIAFYVVPIAIWSKVFSPKTYNFLGNKRLLAIMFRFQIIVSGWLFIQEFDTASVVTLYLFCALAFFWKYVLKNTAPVSFNTAG